MLDNLYIYILTCPKLSFASISRKVESIVLNNWSRIVTAINIMSNRRQVSHSHKHGKPIAKPRSRRSSSIEVKSETGAHVKRQTFAKPLPNKFGVLLKVCKFLNKVKVHGVNVPEHFQSVDPENTGSATKVTFQNTVSKLGLNLSADELESLSRTNKNSRRILKPINNNSPNIFLTSKKTSNYFKNLF